MTDKAPPTHPAELKQPFFAQEHAKNPTGEGGRGRAEGAICELEMYYFGGMFLFASVDCFDG
jgi:hypothetical protein